jgi:uncharacterized protein (UPF0335 family)
MTASGNAQLKSYVERIEHLNGEKDAISADLRDLYAEAKGNGYDVKALRTIIRMRKQDARVMDATTIDRPFGCPLDDPQQREPVTVMLAGEPQGKGARARSAAAATSAITRRRRPAPMRA